jgi:4-hydroxybenzoate polyprenyltransferase/phosphoserine phosphatase
MPTDPFAPPSTGPRPLRASSGRPGTATAAPPLFVDLDGTLVQTDCLAENVLREIKRAPASAWRMLGQLRAGRAALKQQLAQRGCLEVEHLPYREDLLRYLREQREAGRRLYLATGADRSIAERVARHLGLFDGVLASDGVTNLTGERKLRAIRATASHGFAYAGDSRADLAVWAEADAAVLVGTRDAVRQRAAQLTAIEREFPSTAIRPADWLRALRVHQWLKNLLVFVALLTSFRLTDPAAVAEALVAFFAFSLTASAVYVVNDLLDLDADRAHPRKRFRPFAAGRLPIVHGLVAAAVLLGGGLTLAAIESGGLLVVLLLYLATTTAYTWRFKSQALLDVVVLTVLYVLRIVGGAYAIGVPTSVWLLAFALFIFLSLALAKRCSELVSMQTLGRDRARGRGYRVEDLRVLWPVGIATGVSSVLVFALFISADALPAHYAAPSLMWFVALGLFYWLAYLWLKTSRGDLLDDPLVFALRDSGSRAALVFVVGVTLAAHLVPLPESELWILR